MVGADFERSSFDRFDGPPESEGRLELRFGDSPRAFRAGLKVAETQKEESAAVAQHPGEAGRVARPVAVGEHVKETAIEDDVEPLLPLGQGEGILHHEGRAKATCRSLASRALDGRGEKVDPRHVEPPGCEEDRVLTRAAPRVEHRARNPISHLHENSLRMIDVPRGRIARVHELENCAIHHALRAYHAPRRHPSGGTTGTLEGFSARIGDLAFGSEVAYGTSWVEK